MKSLRGRSWVLPAPDAKLAEAIEAAGGGAASAILAARGMDPIEVKGFMEPRVAELLPSPWFFLDMEAACERVSSAVMRGESICIWGDYDVDGATSASIVRRFLAAYGTDAKIYVPDRIAEGYGPNAGGLRRLREEGADLVVIVDSGTVAFDPLLAAKDCGLDVVVMDHHAQEAELPQARAIVNPNRRDQKPGYGMLCAAGVAWIHCLGVGDLLRRKGFRPSGGFELGDLLDLVAMGTVCDVVPLVGLNRAFVTEGLRVMARRGNPGIEALRKAAGLHKDPRSRDLGFILGPRINAGGRIGQSTAGAILLSSDDAATCDTHAVALDSWNRERQEIEKRCVEEAKGAIEANGGAKGFAIAASPEWHEGVVGIVASRLKDFYDVPSFCFSVNGAMAKGSGRGVPGFNLGEAVIEAKGLGLLVRGGGHAMAAGVSCETKKLRQFADFMRSKVKASGFLEKGISTVVDAEIKASEATIGLADAMARMEPYGQGNPSPLFLIRRMLVAKARTNGNRLVFDLVGQGNLRFEAPIFAGAGTPFGESLKDMVGREVDVVASIKVDEWRGRRTARLQIEDARIPA